MIEFGITLSSRELDIVLDAFDRNKDGKVCGLQLWVTRWPLPCVVVISS